jgi:two-component SAPR family response regulator
VSSTILFSNELLRIDSPVILKTAYREYALESYELAVLDYLLKPISPQRLRIATDKLFKWTKSARQLDRNTVRINEVDIPLSKTFRAELKKDLHVHERDLR